MAEYEFYFFIRRAMITDHRCPYCRSEIDLSTEVIMCSDCGSGYHSDCWQSNEGCSVFGCNGERVAPEGGISRVFSAPLLPTVQNMKNHLQINGVESYITNEYLNAALGEIPWLDCWPQLCVREQDAAKAKQIIQALLADELTPQSNWICPQCNEELEGQFPECWNCGRTRD